MKFSELVGLAVITLSLVGCASGYAVTYDSYPQGAILVCNGTKRGYTPTTLYYGKEVKKQSYLLSDCSANWVSGARKTYGTIPVDQYPDGVRETLHRPDVPGFQQDAEFSLKVKQMDYQRRQAQAAEQSAGAQLLQNNNRMRTCVTNYGVTNCF